MAAPDTRSEVDVRPEPDPVIEAYKKDIDRTLIRENLKLTPEERIRQLMKLQEFAEELHRAGRRVRN
jgi:hypothetical protein